MYFASTTDTPGEVHHFAAIIDSNWLNTFRYGHLKRFSNGKMQNFLRQSNQGGLPKFYYHGNEFLAWSKLLHDFFFISNLGFWSVLKLLIYIRKISSGVA